MPSNSLPRIPPRASPGAAVHGGRQESDAEAFLKQAKIDLSDVPKATACWGFYFANGDLDKATAEYASLYSDHPKNAQVKRNYIQL